MYEFYHILSKKANIYAYKTQNIKEILARIGYVRNQANLSAREVSQRIGKSVQYVAQVESGRIVLTVEKLLQILEVCNFPIERFFSPNIDIIVAKIRIYIILTLPNLICCLN